MGRRSAALAGLLALLAVLTLAWRFGAALSLSLALAIPGSDAWTVAFRELPRRDEVTIVTESGFLEADVYRPTKASGALLLVHGLSRAGRRQPDLARLAALLASHGLLVVVPDFAGLAAFRLSGREISDVRSALRYTAGLHRSIAIAGFSFGAGPALIAAADTAGLRLVGSFGGYAELEDVITYVTTGVHAFAGRRYTQHQEEYNRWKLLALLAGFVEPGRDRELLDEIAGHKLAYPGDDTQRLEGAMGPTGRAVMALVLNRREEAVAALLAKLPQTARAALRSLSPLKAVPRIRAPLLIAHGTADESIPFTESLRLAAAGGARAHLALFRSFHHTGPQPFWSSVGDHVSDAWQLIHVANALLSH
jgi:dienelactone hydrolase